MKNIFKIIFILCLGIFAVTGCADNSSSNSGADTENTIEDITGGNNTGGDNTSDDNTGGDDIVVDNTPVFTKLISVGGLSYGETKDGKRYIWGNVGELADAGNKDNITAPIEVSLTISSHTCNSNCSTYYIITDTGLFAWGDNRNGQAGNGDSGYEKNEDGSNNYGKPKRVATPYKVEGITGNIKEVITGSTVYVITDTGLFAWGDNWNGQAGNGTNKNNVLTPYKVEGITGNIKEVITGGTVYVLTDTGLFAWGDNGVGQVGNGTKNYVLTPYKVEGITGNIKEVKIFNSTVYVITDTGLFAWGYNWDGQAGNGTTYNVLTPYKVDSITGNIKEVKLFERRGGYISVYVLTDTGLFTWGYNRNGQAGNGTTDNILTPYKVEGITGNIKEVITGSTVYVITDTGLFAWGYDNYGQVGNGDSGYEKNEDGSDNYYKPKLVLTPYKVESITGNIKEVKVFDRIIYILTDTGLFAWGDNNYGQVGNGDSGYEKNEDGSDNYNKPKRVLTPYKVVGGNIKDFIVSEDYIDSIIYYALTDTGLFAWGYNNYGQVGNGDSGYEKNEDGSDNYNKPKLVLTPYKVKINNIR